MNFMLHTYIPLFACLAFTLSHDSWKRVQLAGGQVHDPKKSFVCYFTCSRCRSHPSETSTAPSSNMSQSEDVNGMYVKTLNGFSMEIRSTRNYVQMPHILPSSTNLDYGIPRALKVAILKYLSV
ncbi:hypothetical protein EDD16DRAFT_405368 [Pisolithus croceorrhizus]|nr:hypothetical protein EDD16DRAFT_405368 [Pisolithus croceorrhizus]